MMPFGRKGLKNNLIIKMMSFGPKGPKNKSYQITSTLISFERQLNLKHCSSIQHSVKMIFLRYIGYITFQSRGLCESANVVILNFSD